MKKAWYLGHRREDIGEQVILVGDPARVDRIAGLLKEPRFLPVTRGLKTVTGRFHGHRVSIVSFGMGAPIATIVLHELADLGVSTFLRIGTAMHFPPVRPGNLIVSDAGLGFEGTSPSYQPGGGPFPADARMARALEQAACAEGCACLTGLFASFDAFYRDMFGIDPEGVRRVEATRQDLCRKGVLAVDMETSALLAAARALDVSFASLCLGTVDALTQEKITPEAAGEGESLLFRVALSGLAALG